MMLRGREALRAFMADWLGGFPDVFIHVADVFCLGNEAAGYKTTMPYVLTATHSGWSQAYGAPSGRKVKYRPSNHRAPALIQTPPLIHVAALDGTARSGTTCGG
jgi:hypothetical protein